MNLDRGLLLLEQGRYNLAEHELRGYLATAPEDGFAHAMLSLALTEQEKFDDATLEAQEAIRCAPWHDVGHRALASVMQRRNRLPEALAAAQQAVQIDSEDPDNFVLLASVHLGLRDWPSALKAAEHALSIDAEHVQAQNLRAMALVNLGRRDEAGRTIGEALSRQPENPLTHANQGWAMLHAGKPRDALEHFREALRLDPTLDWARVGMIEALKARNPVYRLLLLYFLWMSRLARRAQWGILIGGYVGYQFLRGLLRSHPDYAPFIWPVLGLYIAFAAMTWLADPLFNLLLRFNRFGRYLLNRDQVLLSNSIAALLLLALAACAFGFMGYPRGYTLALFAAVMIIPMTATFHADRGRPRTTMIAFTTALALLGLGAMTLGGMLLPLFLLGLLASPWISNAMMMTRGQR